MSAAQKILAVDDNPRNLLVLKQTLAETNAELVQCESGNEALRLSLEHEFSLAILDVQMPDMNGFELAEIFRNDSKTRHLPLIFLSAAYTEERDLYQGYETGAVDYLIKPIQPPILLSKVRVFLELDEQRRQLEEQRKQLEATNRELEAFSYSVSHDLRAPLQRIIGFGEAIEKEYGASLPEEARLYFDRMVTAGKQLDTLVHELLDFSRISRAEMVRKPVDLSALAGQIAADLQRQSPARPANIEIEEGLGVEGDPSLLKVVLDNLLGNAWKYSGKQETSEIAVGRFGPPGAICVRDNGIGFDPGQANLMFDAFVRLSNAGGFEGTGIGLSTVQRIIHRHGGRIWAEGTLGEGATFCFTLPAAGESVAK